MICRWYLSSNLPMSSHQRVLESCIWSVYLVISGCWCAIVSFTWRIQQNVNRFSATEDQMVIILYFIFSKLESANPENQNATNCESYLTCLGLFVSIALNPITKERMAHRLRRWGMIWVAIRPSSLLVSTLSIPVGVPAHSIAQFPLYGESEHWRDSKSKIHGS